MTLILLPIKPSDKKNVKLKKSHNKSLLKQFK